MLNSSSLARTLRAPARTTSSVWTSGLLPWAVPVGLVALAVSYGWWFRDHQLDDPFITYRYAANLAAGRGLVYNPDERVLATTSPLFALVLAGFGRLSFDIPSAAYWISVLSLGAASFTLYRIAARAGRPLVGLIAALLLVSSPDAVLTFGLESTLSLALLTGTIWLAEAGRLGWAGILLGLATLTRGDAVLLGAVLLAERVWRARRLPIRALAGWGSVTGLWGLGATWYFGWPLPVTLTAKVLQGQSSFWTQHFLSGLPQIWQDFHTGVTPLFWWFLPVWLVGLFEAVIRDRRWLIWPIWAALYTGVYGLLHVPLYYWYYAPLLPALAVIGALGILRLADWLTAAAQRIWSVQTRPAAYRALAVVVLIGPPLVAQIQLARHWERLVPFPFVPSYRDLGRWLAQETPADASIGTLEVGLLGYYSGRQMVDFAGLLQPPTARHVARDDFLWAVETYQPDYVVWSPDRDHWLTNSTQFAVDYPEIYRFANAYLDPLIVSRRRVGN